MVDDAPPEDAPENPVLTRQVELAIGPYQGLLPEEVVEDFGRILRIVLTLHPLGKSLVARLTPGAPLPVEASPDRKNRGFAGYAAVHVLCKLLEHIAAKARENGDTRFLCADGPRRVLQAFLSYLPDDESIWLVGDDAAKLLAAEFCATIVACLFLGTVRELEARPALATAWGDTGRALLPALPGALVVLKGALARVLNRDRAFLQSYLACDWDAARMSKRSGKPERVINGRCVDAMRELGLALRVELHAPLLPSPGPGVVLPS
jgi:hypothetical protein